MRDKPPQARFRGPAALSMVLAWLLAAGAGAQDAPVPVERPLTEVVEVVPGATCLEAERLTQRIGRWRERDTVDARIRVKVRGDATASNRVTFTVTKEGGESAERTLSDAPTDCDQLHSAVALAIGLSIDATLTDAGAHVDESIPVPPPIAASEPVPPPAPNLMPEREPPPSAARAPVRLELAIFGGPAVHVFNDTTLMFAPRLTLTPWPWFGFALAGMVTHAGDEPVAEAKGYFNATVAVAGGDVCVGGEPDPSFSVYACGGARVGGLFIEGAGFQKNFQQTELWSALTGSAQVRAWLSHTIAVGAGLTFYLPLAEHVVRVAGIAATADQLVTLPRVGIAVELGPVFRFF